MSDEGFLDDGEQDEDPEDLYCGDNAGEEDPPLSGVWFALGRGCIIAAGCHRLQ